MPFGQIASAKRIWLKLCDCGREKCDISSLSHRASWNGRAWSGVTKRVRAMAEFHLRELHLVKKALCISVLAIERQDGPFQSFSDLADMKAMIEDLVPGDVALANFMRSAHIALTGCPPD